MTRKIIQIAMGYDIRGHAGDFLALCDDGSVWLHREGIAWQSLADIPQDDSVRLPEATRSQIDESDF